MELIQLKVSLVERNGEETTPTVEMEPPNYLPELEKFRAAVLTIHAANLFTKGIDHSQVDEEQIEDTNVVARSHSANDSDGPSTVTVPPPSDQIVHMGEGDDYGSHRRDMSGDQLTGPLLAPNAGTNSSDHQPEDGTRKIPYIWIIVSAIGFGFEAVLAYFDQVANKKKPHYALCGMLLSIVAVIVCLLDLIYNYVKQRGGGASASAWDKFWAVLPEFSGLTLACIQFINAALQYSFLIRQATYSVHVSFVSFFCLFVLLAFKYRSEFRS